MHRAHALESGLERVGQGVVGRAHAGEEGVAAHRRDLDGVEDRRHRRVLAKRNVRVPVGAGPRAPQRLAVLHLVGDAINPRLSRQQVLLHRVLKRFRLAEQRSEAAAEGKMLFRCKRLIANHQDAVVIEPRFFERGELLVAQVPGNIYAGDFGAGHRRQRRDGEARFVFIDFRKRGAHALILSRVRPSLRKLKGGKKRRQYMPAFLFTYEQRR